MIYRKYLGQLTCLAKEILRMNWKPISWIKTKVGLAASPIQTSDSIPWPLQWQIEMNLSCYKISLTLFNNKKRWVPTHTQTFSLNFFNGSLCNFLFSSYSTSTWILDTSARFPRKILIQSPCTHSFRTCFQVFWIFLILSLQEECCSLLEHPIGKHGLISPTSGVHLYLVRRITMVDYLLTIPVQDVIYCKRLEQSFPSSEKWTRGVPTLSKHFIRISLDDE